jgi:hypothetical protein
MVWKPSGQGITADLSGAMEDAIQRCGARWANGLSSTDATTADSRDDALQQRDTILKVLIDRWFSEAAGKPGLTLADLEAVRAKLLDWLADLFHCCHSTQLRCERCGRYNRQYRVVDGRRSTTEVYTGCEPIQKGNELIIHLARIRGFVEPATSTTASGTPRPTATGGTTPLRDPAKCERQQSGRKRGRPADTDERADAQLSDEWEAWKATPSKPYRIAAFAQSKGLTEEFVTAALDRHRHRQKKRGRAAVK